MGSTEIWKLEYKCGFTFVGVMGCKNEAHEMRATFPQGQVSVTQMFQVKVDTEDEAFNINADVAAINFALGADITD